MSQAHRPTWNPTQGRETKAGSQQISKLSLASHTKLKFRQPGQTSSGDLARRDLKAELAAAERVATDKKRKAAGLPPLPPVAGSSLRIEGAGANGETETEKESEEDEEARKRRKILEEAAELDRDDSDEEEEDKVESKVDKGKGKAVNGDENEDEEEDEDEDDDDDDEE
jgi:protein CWC15